MPFDYCILALGSSYKSTIKTRNASLEYRWKQLSAQRDLLASSSSVLIIGGGLVGCELATDIADAFPTTKVTLAVL